MTTLLATGDPSQAAFPPSPVLDCLSDGVIATNVAEPQLIVYVNEAACEITGYDADELLGHSPKMLQGPGTDGNVLHRLREDLDAGLPFSGQATNFRKDGTPFTMEWSISILRDPDGVPEFFVAVQRDATYPARRLLEAEHEARTDPLTGLPNRVHIDQVLDAGGWLSTRARSTVVVDIDHFKALNDGHGHLVGDEVLRLFAKRLAATVRSGDLVARWGGEEFCILTLGDGTDAAGLASRIVLAVAAEPFATSAGLLSVTASAGSASIADGRLSALELLKAADGAMYTAKRLGRNRAARA